MALSGWKTCRSRSAHGEMHARLPQSGRGGTKSPGEFRRSQNWIGGTCPGNAFFVPPPPNELDACLDALERFMHEDQSRLPAVTKAGLIHVQFETIHPFPQWQWAHWPPPGHFVSLRAWRAAQTAALP